MPDQNSAADEHALLQEITAPLATLREDSVAPDTDPEFPIAFRGYDRLAVDAWVHETNKRLEDLNSTRSPEAAVRRALERMGEQISGVLKRAHETAEQITTQSRREAEDRLEMARQEAIQITASAEQRIKDLDADTDRIWAERLRIVEDARALAAQLLALAEEAAARFPPAEEVADTEASPEEAPAEQPTQAPYDAEQDRAEDATAVLHQEPPEDHPDQATAVLHEEPPEDHLDQATAVLHEEPPEDHPHQADDSQQNIVMPPAPEAAPEPEDPPQPG
jgi:hypothetical protein